MKKQIVFLLFALTAVSISAKKKAEHPRAEIMVSYNYYEKFLRGSDGIKERNNEYVLLTNTIQSKFYPPISEYLDSLHSTPSGRELYKQMLTAAVREVIKTKNYDLIPHKKGNIYVFKDRKDLTVSVYELMGLAESGCYTEPLAEMQWIIGDSTKTILEYECVVAHTEYHGRQWTAWFTPELPIQEGPWKLCGLPGLILEASESSGQHAFTATGIVKSLKEIIPIYSPEKYKKVDRKKLLRNKRAVRDNQELLSNAILDSYLEDENHTPTRNTAQKLETDIDFLETDYH
ncbi:MAG: GLPGLI family protein [Bacteroides sp.]|nr:GLPGLI family protein [Bacteroides sp.]